MQVITLMLSVLAFLMGAIALVLTVKERKHNRSSNQSFRKKLVDYVGSEISGLHDAISAEAEEKEKAINGKIDKAAQSAKIANKRIDAVKKVVLENRTKIENLEEGCVPDFNEAMRAVNAVNEMNSGIANIFGYDPFEALQKKRQEGE